jgi:hypothetical protein
MPIQLTRRELAMVGASTLSGSAVPFSAQPAENAVGVPKVSRAFPPGFLWAPLRPPIRLKVRSPRMAVAPQSGTRSRIRRERSGMGTMETWLTITTTGTEMTCSP